MNSSDGEGLQAWRARIEAELVSLSTLCGSEADTLQEAAHYVLVGGGKRLRGLLTYAVWSDLSPKNRRGDAAKPLAAAVALEALHAASLVHDDLPALDNDDMRRGKPSCHKAFGEATAILTADALFGAALLRITSDPTLSTDEQARISRVVSSAWLNLCVGQQLDIKQQQSSKTPKNGRALMIQLKTGALFGASAAAGALCAGVRDAVIDRFTSWGVRIGECFQAIDDLDDGDRPGSDREVIRDECQQVKQAAHDLDPRLAFGTTISLVDAILAV
jgi:geranylgeranyl diphosphate synthase type II